MVLDLNNLLLPTPCVWNHMLCGVVVQESRFVSCQAGCRAALHTASGLATLV